VPAENPRSMLAVAETLAPRWHTAALIALILTVALAGTILQGRAAAPSSVASAAPVGARIVGIYLPIAVTQWSLLLYVCRVGRPRNALRALLGAGWTRPPRVVTDVALAVAGWGVILALEVLWSRRAGAPTGASVAAMLPHTGEERLAWVFVALSAGFCEEVVYRGSRPSPGARSSESCSKRSSSALPTANKGAGRWFASRSTASSSGPWPAIGAACGPASSVTSGRIWRAACSTDERPSPRPPSHALQERWERGGTGAFRRAAQCFASNPRRT